MSGEEELKKFKADLQSAVMKLLLEGAAVFSAPDGMGKVLMAMAE